MHYLGPIMFPFDTAGGDSAMNLWSPAGDYTESYTGEGTTAWHTEYPDLEALSTRSLSAELEGPDCFETGGITSTAQKQRTLAPNLTRRSHRKSRGGCYTCKTRKIKCCEQKPSCRNCIQKDLGCVYPERSQQLSRQIARRPSAPQPSLSTTASTFTLADFRFFHHFLKFAYPTLPAGNDQFWVENVPQLALDNQYLMHAVLCLGASHLQRLTPDDDHHTLAMVHRGHALAGLNQAIAKPHTVRQEADAMLAACYALTFQASYMDDGLQDFITMVRGCALLVGKIQAEPVGTSFDLSPNLHIDTLEPHLSQLSKRESDLIDAGIEGLELVKPLIRTDPEERFHTALINVLFASRQSTREGFVVFTEVYSCWYLLGGDSFRQFTDPSNCVAQMLLTFFVAIQLLMVPATAASFVSSYRQAMPGIQIVLGIVAWGERTFPNIPERLQGYVAWPKMVIATARNEVAKPESERRVLRHS